jgi:hypothetical protein
MSMTQTLRHGMIIATLIIGVAATAVSGQQNPWGLAGGHPAFGGVTPCPPAQCYPLVPGSSLPVVNSGCASMPFGLYPIPAPAHLERPEPSLRVGYLYKDHGLEIKLNFAGGEERLVTSTKNDCEFQGMWAELVFPLVLTHRADFVFTAGHLFPFQTDAQQYYSLMNAPGAKREWSPDVKWWELNTAWAYRFNSLLSGIAGFRWSSFVVEFERPRSQQGFTTLGDEAKLIADAYIPFVGLLLKNSSYNSGCLQAAVLGFPALPGNFEHAETLSLSGQQVLARFSPDGNYKSGYFFEASGEYSVHKSDWNFGAFVRFTAMHCERDRQLNVNGVSSQADLSFDRQNWIFGAKIGFMM